MAGLFVYKESKRIKTEVLAKILFGSPVKSALVWLSMEHYWSGWFGNFKWFYAFLLMEIWSKENWMKAPDSYRLIY